MEILDQSSVRLNLMNEAIHDLPCDVLKRAREKQIEKGDSVSTEIAVFSNAYFSDWLDFSRLSHRATLGYSPTEATKIQRLDPTTRKAKFSDKSLTYRDLLLDYRASTPVISEGRALEYRNLAVSRFICDTFDRDLRTQILFIRDFVLFAHGLETECKQSYNNRQIIFQLGHCSLRSCLRRDIISENPSIFGQP
jgi:hypothetical protein